MNIDQLVRAADPAANVEIPVPDSLLARRSFERMFASMPRRRWLPQSLRFRLLAPAAVATAAVTAAAVVFVSGGPGVPVATSAAAVLNQAAAAAAQRASLTLRPGEYVYTRIRALQDSSTAWGHGISFSTLTVFTVQTWQTAAGKGRYISVRNTPVTIAPSTRAGWIRAGRPNFNKGPRRFTGPAPGFPLDNLSRLPTDPAVLKREIQQGKTGIGDLSADVDEPSTAAGTFWAALLLLTLPSYDGSAALRSALFKVMASVPGDKLIGRVRTRSGRSGIGILTPPFGRGETAVFKVIIDPSTGAILEYDEYDKQGFAEQWSEFLDAGVVKKIGQLPRG